MTEATGRPFTMDGHIDAIYYAMAHGGTDTFFTADVAAQSSLAGLRAGEVDAAFFAIFGSGEVVPTHYPAECAEETDRLMAGYAAWVAPGAPLQAIRTAAELATMAAGVEAGESTPFGVLIHCEGARGIRDLDHLHHLHAQGLRSVGLTWNHYNSYAAGASEDPSIGLSPLGRDLVRELEKLHMVIDAAHLNRQGFDDLLAVAQGPIIVTHTACASLHAHPRCVTDDQIRAVAERDGLLGIFYANIFLAPADVPITIDTVVAHYEHIINLVGIRHVALGTDFGGITSGLPPGLSRAAELPNLFAALRARGYSEADVAALRGGNYRRVLGHILA